MNEAKLYVSVEAAGKHLVLDGDLELLGRLLKAVDRSESRPPNEGDKTTKQPAGAEREAQHGHE